MIKKISHLGLAVENLEESREYYKKVFGLDSSEPIVAANGLVKASMIKVGDVHLELLQPIGNVGVMSKFLEKRGEGFHHICYDVDDIHKSLESMKAAGMEILIDVMDGIEGPSAFLHPKKTHGVLVELVEKKE
jgi:methylmalonyl-CoA/ethylmalonyl-CoA epimerase